MAYEIDIEAEDADADYFRRTGYDDYKSCAYCLKNVNEQLFIGSRFYCEDCWANLMGKRRQKRLPAIPGAKATRRKSPLEPPP